MSQAQCGSAARSRLPLYLTKRGPTTTAQPVDKKMAAGSRLYRATNPLHVSVAMQSAPQIRHGYPPCFLINNTRPSRATYKVFRCSDYARCPPRQLWNSLVCISDKPAGGSGDANVECSNNQWWAFRRYTVGSCWSADGDAPIALGAVMSSGTDSVRSRNMAHRRGSMLQDKWYDGCVVFLRRW